MHKEEVLEKSRAEHQDQDLYEREVLRQANTGAVVVMMILATIFFAAQIVAGGGANWGIWALVFSANMTRFWVKYAKLRRRHELAIAMVYTALVFVFSGWHIWQLLAPSAIL